jgi:hypothetical protein
MPEGQVLVHDGAMSIVPDHCSRLHGGSARGCVCRLPEGGWLQCPPEARGILAPAVHFGEDRAANPISARDDHVRPRQSSMGFTGDPCDHCGLFTMVRTGTCLTCQSCGSTSGGCS